MLRQLFYNVSLSNISFKPTILHTVFEFIWRERLIFYFTCFSCWASEIRNHFHGHFIRYATWTVSRFNNSRKNKHCDVMNVLQFCMDLRLTVLTSFVRNVWLRVFGCSSINIHKWFLFGLEAWSFSVDVL